MSASDIERVKNIGAKSALCDVGSKALWQVRRLCDDAPSDAYKNAIKNIAEARKYLDEAEEFFIAANQIKVKQ